VTENNTESNSLVPIQNTSIVKAGNLIKITNKLVFNEIENIFNEAFYLINSKHFQRNSENFCFLIQYNSKYLNDRKFKDYEANSDEDYEKAIELFSTVIIKQPSFKYAYYLRGIAKDHLKDYKGAISDYTKTIEIDPNFENAYFYREGAKLLLVDIDWDKLIG